MSWFRIFLMLVSLLLLFSQSAYADTQNGFISQGGVTLEVPYIPQIPYSEPGTPPSIQPVPVPNPWVQVCFTIPIPNAPFSFCVTVPNIAVIPSYIVAIITNTLIAGFNIVVAQGLAFIDLAWNAFVFVIDLPIRGFDYVSLGIGTFLLGAVLSIGQPWSVILTPLFWVVIVAFFGGILVVMIWLGSQIKKVVLVVGEP